jgi:YesN/AraC family two-component response regulator
MIIVDDKPQERDGLQKAIEWADIDVCIVGDFANGRLALEAMERSEPRIVLSDISMPVMNGIDLAREVHNRFPAVQIVFMSCYSDFNYAKAAVELGISGYVLKPIDLDELKRTVGRAVQKLALAELQERELQKIKEESRQSLTLAREQYLKQLMTGGEAHLKDTVEAMKSVGMSLDENRILQVASLSLSAPASESSPSSHPAVHVVSYAVKDIVSRISSSDLTLHPLQISRNRFAVLAVANAEKAEPTKDGILTGFLDILAALHEEIGRTLDLQVRIGVSRVSDDYRGVAELHQQAEMALESVQFSEADPIVRFADVVEMVERPGSRGIDFDQLLQEFKSVLSTGTDEEFEDFLDGQFRSEGTLDGEDSARALALTLFNMAALMLAESGRSLRDLFGDDTDFWSKLRRTETFEALRHNLATAVRPVRDTLWGRPTSDASRIVAAIKESIHRRYQEPLRVDDIARTVFLSPRYCNTLFKKETGLTVFDYLTEYRIRMAMQMLKKPGCKVASIAEQVGYDNPSYFCLLFKKHTGLTPAEYKIRGVPP